MLLVVDSSSKVTLGQNWSNKHDVNVYIIWIIHKLSYIPDIVIKIISASCCCSNFQDSNLSVNLVVHTIYEQSPKLYMLLVYLVEIYSTLATDEICQNNIILDVSGIIQLFLLSLATNMRGIFSILPILYSLLVISSASSFVPIGFKTVPNLIYICKLEMTVPV